MTCVLRDMLIEVLQLLVVDGGNLACDSAKGIRIDASLRTPHPVCAFQGTHSQFAWPSALEMALPDARPEEYQEPDTESTRTFRTNYESEKQEKQKKVVFTLFDI